MGIVPLAIVSTAILLPSPAIAAPPEDLEDSGAGVTLLNGLALIMGGSGTPMPGAEEIEDIFSRFIGSNPEYAAYVAQGLQTPEQFGPLTGLHEEGFDPSVAQGVTDLNTAIMAEIAKGNGVVVAGISQSSTIESLEEEYLASLPADQRPSTEDLSFVLLSSGNNPDGGILERFDGAYIPSADLSFSGATPDDVYPTDVYTPEYDGWSDFPQYPLNILADLNAMAGILFAHGTPPTDTPAQLATAVELPTVGDTLTHYYVIPTHTLPLLELFHGVLPAWLLDLVQPDLTVLVNLGYGNPDYGWSTGPANVPTPAGLLPTDVNPITVLADLVKGTVQGVNSALTDLGQSELPTQITGPVTDLENALDNLAGQTDPAVQAFSTGLQNAVDNVTLPAQLINALDPVSTGLTSLNSAVGNLINDQIDPLIPQVINGIGDPLENALSNAGAPEQLTNAVTTIEQLLPILLEAPGNIVTNDLNFMTVGFQDLAANDFAGFVQELELIPTVEVTIPIFIGGVGLFGLETILEGIPLTAF